MRHHRRAIQRLLRRVFGGGQKGNSAPQSTDPAPLVKRIAKTHRDAALRLTDWPTISSQQYRDAKIKTRREETHEQIVEFYIHLIKELEKRGFPFFAFEFYRSPARQKRLKDQGVSKAGPGESPHNWGAAVDVVHVRRFWDLTRKEWDIVGAIGKEVARRRKIPIVWGGDWKFYDPAHWELADWREIRRHRLHDPSLGPCPCQRCEDARKKAARRV